MRLTVYSKKNCPACLQAKALLNKEGIEFEEIDTDTNFDAFEFIVGQGHKSFPQIYKDGELFVEGGFKGLSNLYNKL